jgi:hypothetical protein
MTMKRVFLSFRGEDRKQVDGLRLLAANNSFDIDFYDESVRTPYNSMNSEYIKGKIREKIKRSSITVCLLTPETHKSEWVCWELEESFNNENKVILMGLPNVADRLVLPAPANTRKCVWHTWDIDVLHSLISR